MSEQDKYFIRVVLNLFFLKDINEVITGFASHLFLIGLSTIILIGLLLINLFLTKSKEITRHNLFGADSDVINPIEIQTNTPDNNIKSTIAKFCFSIILFFALMTLGSLYYIKNMGVYYVVLKNDLTKHQAEYLMKRNNNSEEFTNNGLSTRILELRDNKYELILRNGYINEYKADLDLEKVKSMSLEFKPYKIGPQKVANYFKKVKYIQNDIFN